MAFVCAIIVEERICCCVVFFTEVEFCSGIDVLPVLESQRVGLPLHARMHFPVGVGQEIDAVAKSELCVHIAELVEELCGVVGLLEPRFAILHCVERLFKLCSGEIDLCTLSVAQVGIVECSEQGVTGGILSAAVLQGCLCVLVEGGKLLRLLGLLFLGI